MFNLALDMEKAGITLRKSPPDDFCHGASLRSCAADESDPRRMAGAGWYHTAAHKPTFRRSVTDETFRMPLPSVNTDGYPSERVCSKSKSIEELVKLSRKWHEAPTEICPFQKLGILTRIFRSQGAHGAVFASIRGGSTAKGHREEECTEKTAQPCAILAQVRDWLPQVMIDTRTDYITMTRTCNKLLRRVRRRIHQKLEYLYPLVEEGYSNDSGILFMVARIIYQAAETQAAQEHLVRERDGERLSQHPHLEVAGEVLQEVLDKHGASRVVDVA